MSQANFELIFKFSQPHDLNSVKKLLQDQNLPLGGLEDQFNHFILAVNSKNELIGCGGVELYGASGLLRSVAIKSEFQKKNLGSRLILELERFAKEKHIGQLYLLTETAADFFSKHGFIAIDRSNVSENIRETYEYSVACKETAILMVKNI